jgi:hypothetical protein
MKFGVGIEKIISVFQSQWFCTCEGSDGQNLVTRASDLQIERKLKALTMGRQNLSKKLMGARSKVT